MHRLLEFVQETNGGYSAMRLGFLLWILGAFFVWGYTSFQSKTLQDIPESVYIVFGLLTTGKVAQRQIENKTPL